MPFYLVFRNVGIRERIGLLLKQRRLSREDIKVVIQVRNTTMCLQFVVFGIITKMQVLWEYFKSSFNGRVPSSPFMPSNHIMS